MKNKVLVTGGLGFIGSNLVNKIPKDNEVFIIDNLSTGTLKNTNPRIDVKHNLFFDYSKIPDVDCIYHLGMPSSSPMYKANPNLVHVTIADTMKILEYAKLNQVPVAYASTSSLYNGSMIPSDEFSRIPVTDFYTETRYAIERLFELYEKLYEVKSIGLRLFSVYGSGEKAKGKYANLVTQFLLDMKEDRSPILYFKGKQTRDFVYVDDVVDCFQIAMDKLLNKKQIPSIINVGTGKETSLNDLVGILNTELGKNIQPAYIEPKDLKNYVDRTLSDTSRMKACLTDKSFVPLVEGVKKLIKFYGV